MKPSYLWKKKVTRVPQVENHCFIPNNKNKHKQFSNKNLLLVIHRQPYFVKIYLLSSASIRRSNLLSSLPSCDFGNCRWSDSPIPSLTWKTASMLAPSASCKSLDYYLATSIHCDTRLHFSLLRTLQFSLECNSPNNTIDFNSPLQLCKKFN